MPERFRWLLLLFLLCSHGAIAWCFNLAAQEFNLDPRIIYAVAKVESGLRPEVFHTNHNGSVDIGLMQINSVHQQELAMLGIELSELAEPCKNTLVGAWLLRKSIDRSGGELWRGVGLYHSSRPERSRPYVLRVKSVYERLSYEDVNSLG
ncbi:hypothetical protein VL10_24000 [Leclercia adecarboxylata]|nr:hypothetical protein VL10_24000 [Leclercia adecarboxylata]KMN66743.1 hypothetical protein VK95_04440 [Leclercia sp. LK8]